MIKKITLTQAMKENMIQSTDPTTPKASAIMIKLFRNNSRQSSQIVLKEEEEDILEDLDFELENVQIKFPFGIISPYGIFKKVWDIISAFVIIYTAVILPVRLCFNLVPIPLITRFDFEGDQTWLSADLFFDIMIFFDIIVNFLSAYENDAGFLIYKRTTIAMKYIKGWFLIDLISLFPVNKLFFSIPYIDMNDLDFLHDNYKIWRIVRLVKLIRVARLNESIDRIFAIFGLDI
jgi:hypothetical protein